MLKSRNNLWRPENSPFCIKMTLTFCKKFKISPILETLGSCWRAEWNRVWWDKWGLKDVPYLYIWMLPECPVVCLLQKKNLLTKREMCEKSNFFFSLPTRSTRSMFWCHLSSAVGEVVAFKSEKHSKLYYFSNRIFGIGTSGSFEGEATRSQHWSEVLLAGRKYGSR